MNDLKLWEQVVFAVIGIPLAMMLLYMLVRVIATACMNSWWDTKISHTKKLLDVLKDNPRKGTEGENGKC
jgi:hypothetical protein